MRTTRIVAALFVCLAAVAVVSAAEQTTVFSLQQAVRQGLVDVEVVSRGGATGTTVQVHVRRKVPQTVHVQITPGTVFIANSGKIQNMAGASVKAEIMANGAQRSTSVMVLADNARHSYLVESFCLDYHKPAPRQGDSFRLAINDERAARILQPLDGKQPTLWSMQCAVWMDRMGVTPAELKKRYPNRVTDVEIKFAGNLLRAAEQRGIASIPPDFAPEVRKEVAKLFSPDPAVRAAAVDSLAKLGQQAAPALPLIAANMINVKADHHLPATVVTVDVEPGDVVQSLRALDLKALEPLLRDLEARGTGVTVPGAGGAVLTDLWIGNLKSKVAPVRRRAATFLGVGKDARAVEPLIEALQDEDAQVRDRAAEALQKITGKDFGKDADKWRQWQKEGKEKEQPAPAAKEKPAPAAKEF
jgi:hypothetical protein